MKTIIAGSRSITDYNIVLKYIKLSGFDISAVISGTATGVDKLGERYAEDHDLCLIRIPANWKKYGKAAGPLRNIDMAKICDSAIIIWDGHSKGTYHMYMEMKKVCKPYYFVNLSNEAVLGMEQFMIIPDKERK